MSESNTLSKISSRGLKVDTCNQMRYTSLPKPNKPKEWLSTRLECDYI